MNEGTPSHREIELPIQPEDVNALIRTLKAQSDAYGSCAVGCLTLDPPEIDDAIRHARRAWVAQRAVYGLRSSTPPMLCGPADDLFFLLDEYNDDPGMPMDQIEEHATANRIAGRIPQNQA